MGCRRRSSTRSSVNPRQGIDPFLRRWEIIDDTEGLKPIETAIEVPPGVIVTGRLIDKATGRAVPPADVEYIKAPDNVADGDAARVLPAGRRGVRADGPARPRDDRRRRSRRRDG